MPRRTKAAFTVVKRPDVLGFWAAAATTSPVKIAIANTAGTDRAVRVPINGRVGSMRSFLWKALRRRGFRFHSRVDGNTLVCWAEKRPDADPCLSLDTTATM